MKPFTGKRSVVRTVVVQKQNGDAVRMQHAVRLRCQSREFCVLRRRFKEPLQRPERRYGDIAIPTGMPPAYVIVIDGATLPLAPGVNMNSFEATESTT